jgi:hypothetical protein
VFDAHQQMVLQVAADAGQIKDRADADTGELVGGADAGEHEQLWRVDGPATEHDLLAMDRAGGGLHADGPGPFEQHVGDPGVGDDAQVRADARRVEEGAGGGPALAAGDGEMVAADALERGRVEITGWWVAGLDAGRDEGVEQRMSDGGVGDRQRAVAAVGVGGAALEALDPAEGGEGVGPGPAGEARLRPAVII